MHSHEHQFYHIDDSFNTPEKLSADKIFFIAFIGNYFESFKVYERKNLTQQYFTERFNNPDIIRLNCTMLC